MKIFTKIIFALALSISMQASASHLMSGEISYQHIGNGDYKILLTLFRDCQGLPLGQPQLNITSSCSNYTLSPSLLSSGYNNIYCSSLPNGCNGGTFPGFDYYVYADTINLSPCSNWKISFSECCRNGAPINVTSPSSSSFYIESTLNNSFSENSSPVFSYQPLMVIPYTAPICINNTSYDYDGDSIVYSLVAPSFTTNQSASYNMGFSATDPFGIGSSMSFNSQSGNVCKPASSGNVGAYLFAIKAEEYRNGALVGSIIRDVQIVQLAIGSGSFLSIEGIVTDAQNNPVNGIDVELYEYSISQGVLPLSSTATTNAAGEYSFNNVARKQYLVRAIPVDTSYLPTYHESTYFWNTSQLIFSLCDPLVNANINLVSTANPLGTGVVAGYMNGLNIRTVDVFGPVYIYLEDKNTGALKAQTTIDVTGYYQFNNVEDGDYRIVADISGLNMLSTHFPVVSGGGLNGNYDFIATPDGIYALLMTPTGILSNAQEQEILLFPNPGNEVINISLKHKSKTTLQIYDCVGALIYAEEFNGNSGNVSVGHLSKGTYIVSLQSNEIVKTFKWIKE
jgi:hypothetical protein